MLHHAVRSCWSQAPGLFSLGLSTFAVHQAKQGRLIIRVNEGLNLHLAVSPLTIPRPNVGAKSTVGEAAEDCHQPRRQRLVVPPSKISSCSSCPTVRFGSDVQRELETIVIQRKPRQSGVKGFAKRGLKRSMKTPCTFRDFWASTGLLGTPLTTPIDHSIPFCMGGHFPYSFLPN